MERNNTTEYCKRQIEGSTKTCRQIGAVRVYQRKQDEKPGVKAYTKAYKALNARIRYGTMTKEQFLKWATEARSLRDKCMRGELPQDEFERWLADSY